MEKNKVPMEKNLLIAFLLTGVVLAVSQYFLKPASPAPAVKGTPKQEQTTAANAEKPAAAPVTPPPPAEKENAVPGEVHADQEETVTVDTKVFRVVFSNRGAVVRSWILKAYKDHASKELELVYQKGLAKVAAPFSIVTKGQTLPTDPNSALFRVTRSADNLSLTFDYSDGRAVSKKSFVFLPDSYLVEVTSEVSQNGVRVPHALAWRGGFGDSTVTNPVGESHALHYDLSNSKLVLNEAKAAKDGPVAVSGQFSFAGLDDHYFAGVVLPPPGTSLELTTYADAVPGVDGKDEQRVGASVGGDGLNRFAFFAGPKDADLLRRVNPRLEQLIDWGTWFGFIAKPLFLALNWTAEKITHNFGWAIVLVTVVINLLMFPMRLTSLKSARKMQAIQPQVSAINEKIKSMPMKDPRRAELNQQLMDLYSKNGVNPVGGCLPLVIQLPFLVALSTVLSVAIELRGANWLWVSDLSQPETIAIRILPVLLVVVQFVTQRLTPTPGMDPSQAKMMMFMPLVFGYMFYFSSAGLALYWLTGGIVGLAQQFIMNKATPAPAVATVIPAPKKKR
jgi:YidC/Oxa1 family membrane protein insertase